jgi:hypothetical protein
MKKRFLITERQLEYIVKNINEETIEKKITFTDSDSQEIYRLFVNEYLPKIIPFTNETIVKDRVNQIKSITDEKFLSVTKFFETNGYIMSKDANFIKCDCKNNIKNCNQKIRNFQLYFGIGTFKNKDGKIECFTDGVFGVATAKAARDLYVKFQEEILKNRSDSDKYTYGDMRAGYEKVAKQKTTVKVLPKDEPNKKQIDIKVGTQSK